MILRFKTLTPVILLAMCLVQFSFGQKPAETADTKASPTPSSSPKPKETKETKAKSKDPFKDLTAEQLAESAIFIYGRGGGRAILNQIRKTAIERGKISYTNADGRTDQANYQRWTQRAETSGKEKVRLDQEFPSARYSLVFNDDKIFGIVDDAVFTPREDASKAFEDVIVHGLEALLRYKENESKIDAAGKDKVLGVEYHMLDVTDKQSRKTRFYISAKSFRVMMLSYDNYGVTYRRRFYDYNYAQGTLVPYRSLLWAGEKLIEETEVGTVTFGQKIDENMFSAG